MAKKREKSKEGELANFPEEQRLTLLSPRYLAIASSLILVFSAFASLLANQMLTGQVTSETMQRWRSQGVPSAWESGGLATRDVTNARDAQGRKIVPRDYVCPEAALSAPPDVASTSNARGCYNAASLANQLLPLCRYQRERNGLLFVDTIKCIRQ